MLTDNDAERIAVAWDERGSDGKIRTSRTAWAFEQLFDLCMSSSVEDAWKVTELLINNNRLRSDDDMRIAALAAGPIEWLLTYHGQLVIDRYEELAKSDEFFRSLLGGVWRSGISDFVWARVQAVSGPKW